MPTRRQHREYWRRNLRLTALLLGLWALITFVPAFFAREINRISFFGWPLAFYIGAQGALFFYLLLVGVYARVMDRLDREFDVDEQE